jgi:hypothetical protein
MVMFEGPLSDTGEKLTETLSFLETDIDNIKCKVAKGWKIVCSDRLPPAMKCFQEVEQLMLTSETMTGMEKRKEAQKKKS